MQPVIGSQLSSKNQVVCQLIHFASEISVVSIKLYKRNVATNMFKENPFIFSNKYRVLRHLVFWTVHILIFSFLFKVPSQTYSEMLVLSAIWVPIFILYGYPIMYWLIPKFLLKEKYAQFSLMLLLWAIAGYFFNYLGRTYILFSVSDILGYKANNRNPWAANSYLSMNVMAGFGSMIILFKYWLQKQRDFLTAEKEKITAELQLLKAQIHPHFLFNTLNNIYSFSMKGSSKTTDMIAKLSSLLSYMLYDCKSNEVLLEKEIEVMKNYIDLEKERYGNKLEISINIEGDVRYKYIAPLLLLPFVENAFKHGTSEQLEKPWLSMDISVKQKILRCKILNSKNEFSRADEKGIGIENVKKRLAYLYPGKYELKLNDEDIFFVVSLMLELTAATTGSNMPEVQFAKTAANLSI
jgi:two-component system, LytTR family, sensor histidine kinase AlgZ